MAATSITEIEEPSEVWAAACSVLESGMTRTSFNQNFGRSEIIATEGDQLVVGLANRRALEWVSGRLADRVESALQEVTGRPIRATYAILSGNGQAPGPNVEAIETDLASSTSLESVQRGEVGVHVPGEPGDPNYSYIQVTHYVERFWRPFLGLVPYNLYELLRSYDYFVKTSPKQTWPTIALLSDMLGYGDRCTILGRAARPGYKEQAGAIQVLMRHRIIHHWTNGEGTQTSYYFIVRPRLPLLTPKQVASLKPRLQDAHDAFLSRYPEFDLRAWEKDERESAIPDNWWLRYVVGNP